MNGRRIQAEQRGRRAESLAAFWLRLQGWRILARRKQLPMIEVDIVARRGGILAVVEVKHRATIGAALAALDQRAARRLMEAARQLAATAPGQPCARVDLVALAPGRFPRHVRDIQC